MATFNLAEVIEEASELPKIARGRSSEDYDVIIERLQTGKVNVIPNVSEPDRAKLSQKIRGAAQKAGVRVTVRHSKPENKLYFQMTGNVESQEEPEQENSKVKASK